MLPSLPVALSDTSNSQRAEPPASLHDTTAKSHTLVAQQNYEQAIALLSRLLALAPGESEARELLGVCELEMGNVQAAYEVRRY